MTSLISDNNGELKAHSQFIVNACASEGEHELMGESEAVYVEDGPLLPISSNDTGRMMHTMQDDDLIDQNSFISQPHMASSQGPGAGITTYHAKNNSMTTNTAHQK